MENKEINSLINAFVGYRDMLVPIQSDLNEFLGTYTALKGDIEKLSNSFSDDAKAKLDEIHKSLAQQAQKSEELTRKVDQFLRSSTKYTEEVDKLISTFEGIETRIKSVNEIEAKAEAQISKLENIIEEKKKSYNLKELERSLESYNTNLQAVGDFVNKDIAENLVSNSKMIQSIKDGSENIVVKLKEEKKSIDELMQSYKTSNDLLKKIVENNDVNEEYVFDIIDRWAETRNIKIKK
ncbi:MAG: hypothetical protein IJX17_04575 [Clostridia bacterium]|nr:hypothetical protein [Clostridia bacterium]